MMQTSIPDERVHCFHPGQVWKSRRGAEFSVVSVSGKKAQLRDSRDRKIRYRLYDDIEGWALVSDPQYPLWKPGSQALVPRDPNVFPQPGDVFTKGPSRRFVIEVNTKGRQVTIKFYRNIRGNPAFAAPVHTTPWSTWRAWVRHATWDYNIPMQEVKYGCKNSCSAYVNYLVQQLQSEPPGVHGDTRP